MQPALFMPRSMLISGIGSDFCKSIKSLTVLNPESMNSDEPYEEVSQNSLLTRARQYFGEKDKATSGWACIVLRSGLAFLPGICYIRIVSNQTTSSTFNPNYAMLTIAFPITFTLHL